MDKPNDNYFFGMTEQEIKMYEEDERRIERDQIEQYAKDQAILESVKKQVSRELFETIEAPMEESEHYSNFRITDTVPGVVKFGSTEPQVSMAT